MFVCLTIYRKRKIANITTTTNTTNIENEKQKRKQKQKRNKNKNIILMQMSPKHFVKRVEIKTKINSSLLFLNNNKNKKNKKKLCTLNRRTIKDFLFKNERNNFEYFLYYISHFSWNFKSQFVELSKASLEGRGRKEEGFFAAQAAQLFMQTTMQYGSCQDTPFNRKTLFDAVHLPTPHFPAPPCCSAPYEKYATTAEEMKNKLQRMRVSHVISGL